MTASTVPQVLGYLERFQLRIKLRGDCYEWLGFKNPAGYGIFRYNGDQLLAHRFSYEMAIGPIPEGLTLDHLCRNRWCVRPSHLLPVPHAENCTRAAVGRTTCRRGHPRAEHGRLTKRKDWYCRACERLRHRNRPHVG